MIGEVRGPVTADELTAQATDAAARRIGRVWTAQALGWDALTSLALVGARVPDVRLGTAVVPVPPRHPLLLASQALTVQAATGNRLTLGIGAGIGALTTGLFGLPADRPVHRMREYLSVLRPLLRGEPVSHAGDTLTVNGGVAVPGALPPPVLLAALGPAMLRLAGERADGTVTWMAGPRTLDTHVVPRVTAAGRAVEIVAGLPVCVTSDPDGARERVAARFGMAAGVPEYRSVFDREGVAGPRDVALIGDEETVARGVARIAAAGVTEFVGSPFGDSGEQSRALSLLGDLDRSGHHG
ncbi:TIGR03564 family F420-dependent LLM class oxidoreductase [Catenuloplanes nepalensis]|nr:TIGR03564 family F420-dependent LLM class oxidoreductase [Catenuloplanes nepalensis]